MTDRRSGFVVFLTGLSASGKSTLAHGLQQALIPVAGRPVTLLDGDVLRRQVSAGLGFSPGDRRVHLERVSELAAEIVQAGGIALCSVIAPYDEARRAARARLAPLGGFVLVYLSTPLATCEARDPKGLYIKARAGAIAHFTGISDPYEPPSDADVEIDTTAVTPERAVDRVMACLGQRGLLAGRRP